MTDVQVLTLAIAVTVPLSLLLYSNSRISEAKETLRAEIKAETATLRGEMTALRAEMTELRAEMTALRVHIDAGFARLEDALRLHILEHHK
jgi:chromosome segregation ATPase